MLYNMFFINYLYLCGVNKRKKRRCLTPPSETRRAQKRWKIMEKYANEILMLQYRIKRYQAMRNGAMCQTLNGKLQRLVAKQALEAAEWCVKKQSFKQ